MEKNNVSFHSNLENGPELNEVEGEVVCTLCSICEEDSEMMFDNGHPQGR